MSELRQNAEIIYSIIKNSKDKLDSVDLIERSSLGAWYTGVAIQELKQTGRIKRVDVGLRGWYEINNP
jgi:predicted transcriptional regulator